MNLEEEFKLFEVDADKPILPPDNMSLNDGLLDSSEIQKQLNSSTQLMSKGIERALKGEKVSSVLLDLETSIKVPNYVLDAHELDTATDYLSKAVDAVTNRDGDTAIYWYSNDGLFDVGVGDGQLLERMLPIIIKKVASGNAKLYKNFEIGKPLNLIDLSKLDYSKVRLDL